MFTQIIIAGVFLKHFPIAKKKLLINISFPSTMAPAFVMFVQLGATFSSRRKSIVNPSSSSCVENFSQTKPRRKGSSIFRAKTLPQTNQLEDGARKVRKTHFSRRPSRPELIETSEVYIHKHTNGKKIWRWKKTFSSLNSSTFHRRLRYSGTVGKKSGQHNNYFNGYSIQTHARLIYDW